MFCDWDQSDLFLFDLVTFAKSLRCSLVSYKLFTNVSLSHTDTERKSIMALTTNKSEFVQADVNSTATAQVAAEQPPVNGSLADAFNWRFGGRRLNGVISYSIGSELLQKLRGRIADIFKNSSDPDIQVGSVCLDNTQTDGIYYSSIVLTMQSSSRKDLGVTYYVLMLAGSNDPVPNRQVDWQGNKFEIQSTASAALDGVYVSVVEQTLAKLHPGAKLLSAGGMVVPADFNFDSDQSVQNLVFNAQSATYMRLTQEIKPDGVINLATAKGDNSLRATISFNRGIVRDVVDQPIRSDIEISFSSGRVGQPGQVDSVNRQSNRVMQFGSTQGYIDAVWAPLDTPNGWGIFNPQVANAPTQKYAARFVITRMENAVVPTLGAFLLQLISATRIGINNAWYQVFYGQSRYVDKKGGMDYTDVGALNLEANLPTTAKPMGNPNGIGDFIDTKSKDFTPEMFGMYMQRIFRQGLIFSMDVPIAGSESWYLQPFERALRGDQSAIYRIMAEADTLTNGNLKRLIGNTPGKSSIVVNDDCVVHLGYYETDDGRRDIRDIDTVAVCNAFGQTDIGYVRKYSDTYFQTGIPLDKRLADRWNIIQAITKNKAVCTGYAYRVTFTDTFITALNEAAKAAGLQFSLSMPMTGATSNIERGRASFVDNAIVSTFGSVGSVGSYGPGGTASNYAPWNNGF